MTGVVQQRRVERVLTKPRPQLREVDVGARDMVAHGHEVDRRKSAQTPALAWRVAAAGGALLGLGGYASTLVSLALGTAVAWSPALAASGAVGAGAAAAAWRKTSRSWLAAVGLGAFWLPFAAGAILSLVRIIR